ncbi:MAG: hypothetical protein ACT4R6_14680 [Gemmatimonadaceae bacterium]
MNDDLTREREISTADVARSVDRARESQDLDREAGEREVSVPRAMDRADSIVDEGGTALLPPEITDELRARWSEIQTGFVDEPRRSVERADGLVADAIKHLADSFAAARTKLEQEWARGEDASTEDLRQALQHYRSFFGQLLRS